MRRASPPPLWAQPFILLCLANLVLNIAFYATQPVFPLFLTDRFGLAGIAMGLVVASYTASAIMTRPPTGYCLDRFGRKVVYLPGCLVFALIYFLYPLAGDGFSVALVRFAHGALWGVTMGAGATVCVDLLPAHRRGEGIGYFGLGMIVGMALGPAVGLALAEWKGFDFLFAVSGALTLVSFGMLCRIAFPVLPRRKQPFTLATLLEKTSLPASLATLIFCIPFAAMMNYTGLFARSVPGASAGAFFLFMALGTALTRVVSGRVFDRRGPGFIMVFGYGFLLLGGLLLSLAHGRVFFTAGGLFLGFGYGVAIPVIQAMINGLVPSERRGAANATMMTAFDLGICLGLLCISHAQTFLGWHGVWMALTGCIGLSAAVFRFWTLPDYRKRRAGMGEEKDPAIGERARTAEGGQ